MTSSLWELCSKFSSLFYSNVLSKSLHYAQFYTFYAAYSITIPYLQFKLPIKVSCLSYLTLLETLKVLISLSLSVLNLESRGSTFTFFLLFYIFYLFYMICTIVFITYTCYSLIIPHYSQILHT